MGMDTTRAGEFEGHDKEWFEDHLCRVADVYVIVELAPKHFKPVKIDRAMALELVSGPGKKYGFVSTAEDYRTSLLIGGIGIHLYPI